MANLIKRNLETWLDDPFRNADDLFRGFFMRPVEFGAVGQVKIDVREDDKAYTVHAELPGVNKDNIDVQIDGDTVSISAELRQEKEEKEGEKVLRSERYYGKVARSFRLGSEIDDGGAQASYRDGVLELTLPKKVGQPSRKRLSIE